MAGSHGKAVSLQGSELHRPAPTCPAAQKGADSRSCRLAPRLELGRLCGSDLPSTGRKSIPQILGSEVAALRQSRAHPQPGCTGVTGDVGSPQGASLTVQALIDEMPALLIKASRIEKTCDSHSDRALPTPAIIVAADAGVLLSPRIRLRENAVVGSSATSTSAGVDGCKTLTLADAVLVEGCPQDRAATCAALVFIFC